MCLGHPKKIGAVCCRVIVVVVIAVSRIGLSLTLAYKKYLVVHGFAITGLGRIVG